MENLNPQGGVGSGQNQIQDVESNMPPPVNQTQPPPDVISSSAVTTVSEKKGSKFGIFVVIGIIIIIVIYAGVAYIYLQNQNLKKTGVQQSSNSNSTKNVSPTPSFSAEHVKIVNGNVVYQDPSSEAKVLVSKESFPETGITGFAKVSVSPDNSKICFESWPPSTTLAVYSASSDGNSAALASKSKKNCLFTSDNKKLLYMDASLVNSESNIFVYDLETKEEKNLTGASQSVNGKKKFELVGLSADTNKVVCKFEPSESGNPGQCEIDLTTFELSYI